MNAKSWTALWIGLLGLYLVFALGFSIIQPLGRTPDETAHVQYAKFLADHLRLPRWQAEGGGEAGYEAQHPPLYYVAAAVVYRLTAPLEERWRWQILRWATISIGVALLLQCRSFFRAALKSESAAFAATATVVLMPLTLLYTGYVNPDGMTMLWVTAALFLTWKTLTEPAALKYSALLGLVCGLALLTKLSGLPALLIALLAQLLPAREQAPKPSRFVRCAVVAVACALTCGWWYLRSALLYGSPFIHTRGKLGTGFELAQGNGLLPTAWLTWRETFLSTWAQRGWFPGGLWEYALYGAVCILIVLAVYGLNAARKTETREAAYRPILNLSALLVLLVFLGQQWAFWTTDVEFNAGGRYILTAMAAIALLLTAGIFSYPARIRRLILCFWGAALVLMNLASAWNIDTVLNPTYAPNWQYFHFVPGEEKQ